MKQLLAASFALMLICHTSVGQLKPGLEYPYANQVVSSSAFSYDIQVNRRDGAVLSTLTVPRGYWLIVYCDSVQSPNSDLHKYFGKVAIWTTAQADTKPGETMTQMIQHSPKIEFNDVVATVTTTKK